MNITKFASGDNNKIKQSVDIKEIVSPGTEVLDRSNKTNSNEEIEEIGEVIVNKDTITPTMIDENELKLKERIAQCKSIIASLKLELNEEKIKLEKEAKKVQSHSNDPHKPISNNANTSDSFSDLLYNANKYSACIDSKFNCDDNLMEYEKQLQRYQNTLNMAQIEKKNAIRKQMLAKAFKLKLMEVENQCNIELLRIKQNLQCLEPLQMITEKWKNNDNDIVYDLNNFELIPRYPELGANSGSDITNMSGTEETENKIAIANQSIDKHE